MIPDSLSCIPDSKPRIPDSTIKSFPDSAIRIPLRFLFENHSIAMSLLFVCLFVCLFSPRCLLSSRFLNFYKSNLAPCKVKIWLPGSWNFFLLDSGIRKILACWIRNSGLWNRRFKSRNPESRKRLESRIQVPRKRNPEFNN